jgi:hypothetical protein
MPQADFYQCDGPEWTNAGAILQGPRRSGRVRRLLGALLTSYEIPDSAVLVESLLPEWLGLERPFTEDTADGRYLFFAEIDRALKALNGCLTVFHSPDAAPSDRARQSYPWLFRHIRCFQVGRTGPAVQHSKFWMFHWIDDESSDQHLEIVISSCNLSADALKSQIQAGWRAEFLLGKESQGRLHAWGMLVPFLEALGRSSAEGAMTIVQRWVRLLSRAEAPVHSVFVASAPGRYSRTELRSLPWGMAGLRHVVPSSWHTTEIEALVPSIGMWNAEGIRTWASQAKAEADTLLLAWPPANTTSKFHFPVNGMSLQPATLKAFRKAKVGFLALPPENNEPWKPVLHPLHQSNDPRWPHCKLYWFGRTSRRREAMSLVTSANLSQAAWGCWHGNTLQVTNFELGVAFFTHDRSLLKLSSMNGPPHVGGSLERAPASVVAWADASWDGQVVRISLRLAGSRTKSGRITAHVLTDSRQRKPLPQIRFKSKGKLYLGGFKWRADRGIPSSLELGIAAASPPSDPVIVVLPVVDLRLRDVAIETPCPEIPEEWLHTAEIRLLIERYGGRLADQDDTPQPTTGPLEPEGDGKIPADFRVEIIEEARRYWRIIDAWQDEITIADSALRPLLLRDGRKLRDYWRDLATTRNSSSETANRLLAAGLAARETTFRLRRIPK